MALLCVPLWAIYIPRKAEADRLIAVVKETAPDPQDVADEKRLSTPQSTLDPRQGLAPEP